MKQLYLIFLCLLFTAVLHAQGFKSVNVTAGRLSSVLTANEKNTITNLTVTGTIDARDFKTMRDEMPLLTVLDMGNVSIVAYTGNAGPLNSNVTYPVNTIPECAFCSADHKTGKTSLITVIFPSTLKGIDRYAFLYCSGLTGKLILPTSLTSIRRSAFNGCGFTGVLTIPAAVTTIERCAFYNCPNFTGDLIIPSKVDTIGELAFAYCVGFDGSLTISNSVSTILESAFDGCTGFTGKLTLPSTLTSLGKWAFYDCKFTGSLTIPSSLKTINEGSFSYCTGFSGDLTIPSSVDSIGNWAFEACSGFSGSLTIGSSVKSIGKSAFIKCSGLTGNLTIPNSVTEIGAFAFDSCINFNRNLEIGTSIKNIREAAFQHCSGFTGALIIPSSVDTIEAFAFSGCKNFTELTIPTSIKGIGGYAFQSCKSLASIYAYAMEPVNLSSESLVFNNVDKSTCTLNVPIGSKTAYQSADQWNEFKNIVEFGNLWISNSIVNLKAAEGSSAMLTINSNVNWTCSSNQSWLTVSPTSGTVGNKTLTFTAAANQTSMMRTAVVTITIPGITSKTITVNQSRKLADIIIDFKPRDVGVTIDSVLVTNLSTNKTVKLTGIESLLLTSETTDVISLLNNINQGKLFPNPCNGLTTVSFSTNKSEKADVFVHNASGQLIAKLAQNISSGTHKFSLQLPGEGIYFVSIQKSDRPLSFKVISSEAGMKNISISYLGSEQNYSATIETEKLKNAAIRKTMGYSDGEYIMCLAYSGKNITVLTDKPAETKTYTVAFYQCVDKDGRNYKTVTIGSQTWMAENLAYLPKVNSPTEYSNSSPYYYVGDYSGSSISAAKAMDGYKKYGALYNWAAASTACPVGWHLPTDEEWETLEMYLQKNGFNYDGLIDTDNDPITNNKIAKSLAWTSGWEENTKEGTPGNNPLTNNSSGFSGIPGSGYFYVSLVKFGGWGGGDYSCWWTKTQIPQNTSNGIYRDLWGDDFSLKSHPGNKGDGYSVRCVKD